VQLTCTIYSKLTKTKPVRTDNLEWDRWLDYYVGGEWLEVAKSRGAEYPDKESLPLYGLYRLKEGAGRSNENVEQIFALSLDFDQADTLEDIESVFGEHLSAIHTTWKHVPASPRCRLILGLSRPIEVGEHYKLVRWALRYAEDHGLSPDPSCKDPARAWFVPCTEDESLYDYAIRYEDDASPLDVDEILNGNSPTSGEAADDVEFTTMDGSRTQILDWGRSSKPGDKLRGACPWIEGASLGSAFLRKCKTGVMCVCTSQNHGHALYPHKTWHALGTTVVATWSPTRETEDLAVLAMLEPITRNGQPTGRIRPTASNLDYILRHDPRLKDRIWLNEFSEEVMLDNRPWVDEDDTDLVIWLDRVYHGNWSNRTVRETSALYSRSVGKNPLKEWISSETWDGESRLNSWLTTGFGVPDTPLSRVMARKWAIQAIARAFRPGCQADTTLVLVGPQGVGKSTGLRMLAGDEYFSDTPLDFSKDAFLQIQRTWIYEIAELDSFRGRAHSAIKAFLSASSDTYRAPYAIKPKTHLRHCCFSASTNETAILSDATGSRRFWPVHVTQVDRPWIKENRRQLWSEALRAFESGEIWWLTRTEEFALQEAQQKYRVTDAWEELIVKWLELQKKSIFSMEEVMHTCLDLFPHQMDTTRQMRVAETLRRLGFEKVRKRNSLGRKVSLWQRPEEIAAVRK